MLISPRTFRDVSLVDFEFSARAGERPNPVCLVAKKWFSGRTIRIWQDELRLMERPPYATGNDSLFVAFYASAELTCHLVLGWPLPTNVLDLFVEFRNLTNGLSIPCGATLLGALTYFKLDGIDVAEKDSMRQLAMRGAPWSEEEQNTLLDYCESDVLALEKLLYKML